MNIGRKIYYRLYRRFMLDHFHHVMVDQEWMKWKGYKVDWENPRDINEKIQWLMCYSDTSRWSECADKIKVRDYVASKGYGDFLVPLLGTWSRAEDIDFDQLPDKFAIKCNHDSGSCRIVDKASGFDPDELRAHFSRCLKAKYGYVHGEMYYNDIRPMILAEPFLEATDKEVSSSLVDYKVWCFDGVPYSVLTCSNRTGAAVDLNIYDKDWNVRREVSLSVGHYKVGDGSLPRPDTLNLMLEAASALSKGFPEVRVDFYEICGKPFFGELTFSSLCGKMNYFTDDYLAELGRQCILPDRIR